ncbi:MAG: MerR family transcriptional regulator [Chitinophagales bacterium]|nr:MerR family transcriptional regulator [Bacteroidota bacterium]MBP7398427.1 MerR family transcriptional regulator [Chitinophagales bacterium]MBK8488462.1 MerR family transcriptional regulator [Bacteroidota bacterium]MBK8681775.1 MerR family transcriptional regulator [Bacteroidota bacterium]MBP8753324.1 MerR family transcriptional regulator [Chitinophagales bacterium]
MSITYSIKDLETYSGIKAHTIRIWEQRYGILKAARTSTNIRYYTEDEVKYLMSLALLNRKGKKISTLSQMSQQDISDAIKALTKLSDDYRTQIEAMIEAAIAFNEIQFLQLFNSSIKQIGFEPTMIKIIFPFLEKLGVLWVSGGIMAAQEHFISQLIRQKLIVCIDANSGKLNPNSKRFVLFLPNGEWHELTLLFLHYLLKVRRQNVTYLGPSVPLKDVLTVGERLNPDYFYTIITNAPHGYSVSEYLNKLSDKFPDSTVFASGVQLFNPPRSLNKNVSILNNMEDVTAKIEDLTGNT